MNQPETSTGPGRPTRDAEAATSFLHLRITRARKSAYVRAASKRRQGVSEWSQHHLDAAAGYTPTNNPTNPQP